MDLFLYVKINESYDHMSVEDDVPLLENPFDSFLNDILQRKQAYN